MDSVNDRRRVAAQGAPIYIGIGRVGEGRPHPKRATEKRRRAATQQQIGSIQ